MTPTAAPALLTAEEFVRLHGHESGVELVDGRLVRLPMPGFEHGDICLGVGAMIRSHVKRTGLGRVAGNDTFVRVKADPPTYRGADVCFLSYARLPKDQPPPKGPLEVAPELVVEVKSPTDRVKDVSAKAYEHLEAGVAVVLVLDPDTASAAVYRADEFPLRYSNGDEVSLADVLPGFSVPARAFFE